MAVLKGISYFGFVLILIAVVFQLIIQEPESQPLDFSVPQTEIKSIGLLLDDHGRIMESGWMSDSHKVLNEGPLQSWLKTLRYKKWDYYDFFHDNYTIQFAFADLGYIGNVYITIYDINTNTVSHFEKLILPGMIPKMSSTSYRFINGTKDDIVLSASDFQVEIRNPASNTLPKVKFFTREIKIEVPAEGVKLQVTLNISREHDSIGMLSPLSSDRTQFFYNLKAGNYPIEGTFQYKGQTIEFNPKNTLGGSDWGRGIWPYHTFWIWARGQGRLPGTNQRFALNMGHGFQDHNLSKATEDAYFINEHIHKLNAAETTFDENNLLNPWQFSCVRNNKNFRECEVTFRPSAITKKQVNLVFIKLNMQIVYGTFEGWVSDENNRKIEFSDLHGLVELNRARW